MQSFIDGSQYAYGGVAGVGPSAFVASATEGTSGDIIVAIPAGSSTAVSSLNGNYTAGYVNFPNSDVTQVREAAFNFSADGAGNLSNVSVTGTALNLGGGTPGTQTISGASYTLSGEGAGVVNLGAVSPTQVLSGSMNFYLSADGNLFMAGTPGGMDLIVGSRSFSGTAANSNWNNVYFTAGLEDDASSGTHALDAFYGSWNANGQGSSIVHQRYQSLASQSVYDYTFSSQDPVQPNGTSSPSDINYQFNLGAGGQVFIATGTQGLYSLMIGFAAPQHSGNGVFLNPLAVVNAANYAPITNPIAPGELITVFGSGLASTTLNAPSLPLATTLGGVQLTVNGQAAPLVYVSPTQITAVVPQQISPANNINNATIQVMNNGTPSNTTTVYTNYTAPGLFASNGSGTGPAAAQVNNAPISAANPLNTGQTVVLYATGLGTTTPVVPDGAAAPSNPPATADDTDAAYVGGQQENISFDGLTPGLAALYQVNADIQTGTPLGTDFADIATPDAYTSEATLAIGRFQAAAQARLQSRTTGTAAKHKGLPSRARIAPSNGPR
jgi:uncharacterized protein (TIGR03437 family)